MEWADIIVFADVETKCLTLHPDFFNRAKWENRHVTFPDRFDKLRAWVDEGGHFHMNGESLRLFTDKFDRSLQFVDNRFFISDLFKRFGQL